MLSVLQLQWRCEFMVVLEKVLRVFRRMRLRNFIQLFSSLVSIRQSYLFHLFLIFSVVGLLSRPVLWTDAQKISVDFFKTGLWFLDLSYSTMFLMGPVKQLKRMCDKTRALATAIMIVSVPNVLFIWPCFSLIYPRSKMNRVLATDLIKSPALCCLSNLSSPIR